MAVSGHASPTAIYAVVYTANTIAIFAVSLRLYTRLAILRKLAADDVLMVLALVFNCVFTVCQTFETYHGLGHHLSELTQPNQEKMLRWFWISALFYHLALGLAKLSIVLFGSIRKFLLAGRILATVLVLYTLFAFLNTVFLCRPLSYFWNRHQPGSCLPRLPVWFLNVSMGIVTDIAVAVLPLPVVNKLRIPPRQKCMLMLVFGLGGAVCLITIVRFYSLYSVATSTDDSWQNPQAALYSNVESSVTILGGCLPTYNAFVARHFPGFYRAYAGVESNAFVDMELYDSLNGGTAGVASSRSGKVSDSGESGSGGSQATRRHVERLPDTKEVDDVQIREGTTPIRS